MSAYGPARACLVINDNGEERLVDAPEITELLAEALAERTAHVACELEKSILAAELKDCRQKLTREQDSAFRLVKITFLFGFAALGFFLAWLFLLVK